MSVASGQASEAAQANTVQGTYGEALVCALATAAGLTVARVTPDADTPVRVPRDSAEWVAVDHATTSLRHAAYWVSLESSTPVELRSDDQLVTVTVPGANLLTPQVLRDLVVGVGVRP